MNYDITLNDPVTHETLTMDAPRQMRGGTYAIGGTSRHRVISRSQLARQIADLAMYQPE